MYALCNYRMKLPVPLVDKLKEFLQIPVLPAVRLQNKGKKLENARVLTSNEFLHELEKLKAEKETQKQLRKQQREEKKAQKTGAKKVSANPCQRMGQKVSIIQRIMGYF